MSIAYPYQEGQQDFEIDPETFSAFASEDDEDPNLPADILPLETRRGDYHTRQPRPLDELYTAVESAAYALVQDIVARDERYHGYVGQQCGMLILSASRGQSSEEVAIHVRTITHGESDIALLTGQLVNGKMTIC